jgi:hypothetical protein
MKTDFARWFKLSVAIFFFTLCLQSCAGRKPRHTLDFEFNKSDQVENSNFYNMNKMFAEMQSKTKEDEYYFAILGDTQNLVRSYDWSGFNQVAKHLIYAKDKNEEHYVYDKVKFVIHLGDIVYEGFHKQQWDNLKKAFSKKDYYSDNYPYIKMLVKDKPMFPVVGNHELMDLKPKKETKYRNLASENVGLEHFYDFFNWEEFYSNPNIFYCIPAELTTNHFNSICNDLDAKDVQVMNKHYVQLEDSNYYLRMYQDIINKHKNGVGFAQAQMNLIDEDVKNKTVYDLQRIYTKLGYNTLPALSSDNMANYAFEINDHIFLVFDSMTRGWQYDVFTDLKESLYHNKEHQHYLNLFSKSDLNGQYEFC